MRRVFTLIGKRQQTVGGAAIVLMFTVFLSRILGLLRDRLLAARFTPEELGVYFAAFRLPNLLFELLVMGALTSAFIPVFTKYLSNKKIAEAWQMTASLINISLLLYVIILFPIFIWTDQISRILVPGFTTRELHLMSDFIRFMLLAQVLPLLIGNFYTGILQSFKLFLIPALAPVVYNFGIIIGIIVFSPSLGLWGPVIGVGIGAILFMLIQVPSLIMIGYRHSVRFDMTDHGVREVGSLMAPRTLGLAVSQIDTTIDLMLASLLGAKMVTIFSFAQHLQYLPVGLFGATIGQAVLPTLSEKHAEADHVAFRKTVVTSIHQIVFFVLPVSVLFIVLRIPIVRLVFGASLFDWEATVLTGVTLSAFSLSIFAQSISHVLTRAFYALHDTKTPMFVAVITIILNSILSVVFVLIYRLPIWSLGLSATIAGIVHATALLIILARKIYQFSWYELLYPAAKMTIATVLSGILIYVPLQLLDQLVFDTTRVFGLILLTGFVGSIGFICYIFLSWVFGVTQVHSLWAQFDRIKRMRTLLFEPVKEIVDGGTRT